MKIVREVGDFPWTSVAHIRKIIARKLGEQEFNRQWDAFWAGAQTLHERTDYPPVTLEQMKKTWGSCVTSGSYAFNAAHCAAYALLAYWTMWFKIYHPAEFYAASAKHYADHKQRDILRDADKHGIKVLTPRANSSSVSWKPVGSNRIRAGYSQIDGIGDKTAKLIADSKLPDFDSLTVLKGIGSKTVEKIKNWVAQDDPFDIYRLEKNIAQIKLEINNNELDDVPLPTHTSREIDDVEPGANIIWIGEMVKCNVRDIFEINVAKSGEALDPTKIKDPHLREFAILYARDADDQTMIKFNRWVWPRYKQQIFELEEGDLLVIKGRKPRYGIMVNKLWVVRP
jgi:DNA polymerase-3 subunit alpha